LLILLASASASSAEPASIVDRIGAWKTSVKPANVSLGAHSSSQAHKLKGVASYYWQGHTTASGERFDKRALTAAHKTLPFNSLVRVKDSRTGNSVVVRINDRGPFIPGRVIDLSEMAAEVIGMKGRGVTPVELEVLAIP
jgi:rare lipoprotein A